MEWVYYLILLVVSLVGLALAIIGLPGIWLIVAAAGVYAYLTSGAYIALWGLLTLMALGVVAEVMESALGGVAAGKAGGSKRSMIAAIGGGIVGAILGTPLIPIPIVGTVVGACVGSFVAAFAVEIFWLKKSTEHSLKIGAGAAAGKFAGIVTKLLFGGLMVLVAALWSLPLSGTRPAAPVPPPIMPTTLPQTDDMLSPTTAPTTQPG